MRMHRMMHSILFHLCIFILSASTKQCTKDFDIKLNTIILTNESEKNGAKFIHKLTVDSLEECIKYCCDSTECSVGVFGPKKDSTCFLFNCHEPSVCNFTSESDYTVFIQRNSKPILPRIHKVETIPAGDIRGMCGPHNPCTGENTICDSGQCACKAGFIEKRHKCVPSLCSKPDLQFQCDDGTACIAIYDVCNGINECQDGSDEAFCDKSVITPAHTSPKPSILKTRTVESKPSESLHKIVLNFPSSRSHFSIDSQPLHHSTPAGDSTDIDYESTSMKELPNRVFNFIRDVPSRRSLRDRKDYLSPDYFSSIENDEPTLVFTEPRRKSFLSNDAFEALEDRPSRRRLQAHGNYFQPRFLKESSYADDEFEIERSRKKPNRPSGHSRYAALQDLIPENEEQEEEDEEEDYLPHIRRTDFKEHRGFQRRKPIRRQKISLGSKSKKKLTIDEGNMGAARTTDKAETSTTSSISSFMHSGFQWHTAAIVLAVGLGLISCLFGILVGRCRKRGQFEKEGPRSKAVAQRNLRRRIMRTRGLSNSDMEKNGLLSKLQL